MKEKTCLRFRGDLVNTVLCGWQKVIWERSFKAGFALTSEALIPLYWALLKAGGPYNYKAFDAFVY